MSCRPGWETHLDQQVQRQVGDERERVRRIDRLRRDQRKDVVVKMYAQEIQVVTLELFVLENLDIELAQFGSQIA